MKMNNQIENDLNKLKSDPNNIEILNKIAKFYFEKVLPRAEQHYKSAISGSSNIMNFKFN